MPISIAEAARYGFHFPSARHWIDEPRIRQQANDAALITSPNTGVPVELTTFFNPKVVTVLTAPLRARAIFSEEKNGDATTTAVKIQMMEFTGTTVPYDDFSDGGTSGVNFNWPARDNYLFQTVRRYGDLEEEKSAVAKINLAGRTQMAAARIIDVDANRFYFLGVAGLRNYGILNDPGLNAPIAPAATGTGSSVLWSTKTTRQRYDDVLALFKQLVTQLGGNVTESDRLMLVMSPSLSVLLGTATDFNVSVLDMMKHYFSNLSMVTAPEYSTASGELMQMIAPEIQGEETASLGVSEKFRAFAPVRQTSSIVQKFRAGTYGAIIKRPAAIAGMLGM